MASNAGLGKVQFIKRAEQPRTSLWMAPNDRELILVESARLEKDFVGNGQLPQVMNHRRDSYSFDLALIESDMRGEPRSERRHSVAVPWTLSFLCLDEAHKHFDATVSVHALGIRPSQALASADFKIPQQQVRYTFAPNARSPIFGHSRRSKPRFAGGMPAV
jgi:hypothetical protein